MSFFISTAYAAGAAAGAAEPNKWQPLLLLLVFVAFIYLVMWRPQAKRAKQHRAMLTSLKAGDEIVTNGGIVGQIKSFDENFAKILIDETTVITLQKSAIVGMVPKGTMKFKE